MVGWVIRILKAWQRVNFNVSDQFLEDLDDVLRGEGFLGFMQGSLPINLKGNCGEGSSCN